MKRAGARPTNPVLGDPRDVFLCASLAKEGGVRKTVLNWRS